MTFTQVVTETFHVVSCYSCGVKFGIEGGLYKRVVTDAKDSVYCPACGARTCWRESDDQLRIKQLEQKLKWEAEEAARQKRLREAAEESRKHAELSLRSTQGVVTKLKKRASAGTCPCCQRTFRQLAAHMQTKHPDFIKQ